MELLFNYEDEQLTIQLPPTIDTSNAQQVEDTINNIINENNGFQKLVLDAINLNYISSVGLRIVLRLSQLYENIRVLDVKNEVYDIFEMTGFTDIIDIEKVLKEVSIEGCPIIGEGFYGRVYRISPDTIVKVYFRGGAIDDVKRERKLAKTAFILGIPTAISYDIVKVKEQGKECYGSVFELLEAKSLRDLVRDNPNKFAEYVKMHADLVKKINSTTVLSKDLPYAKEATKDWMKTIKGHLDENVYEKLEQLIETIPDVDFMVHGDCHVKNILVQNNEPILIDMDTLSKGHEIFDVVAFYLTYVTYEQVDPGNTKRFLDLDKQICLNLYQGIFQQLYGDRSQEEQAQIQLKVETLAYILFYSRALIYYPEDENRRKFCIEKLTDHVEKLDSLAY